MKTKASENQTKNLFKNQIESLETSNFKCHSNHDCKTSKVVPNQETIKAVLLSARKKPLETNSVVIARYQWLLRRQFEYPTEVELPNLCLVIKNGKLKRAFYSNVLTHVIKKQNYHIQILN